MDYGAFVMPQYLLYYIYQVNITWTWWIDIIFDVNKTLSKVTLKKVQNHYLTLYTYIEPC